MTTSLIKIKFFKKQSKLSSQSLVITDIFGFSESKILSGVCRIPHYAVLVEGSIGAFFNAFEGSNFVYRKDYSEDNLKK